MQNFTEEFFVKRIDELESFILEAVKGVRISKDIKLTLRTYHLNVHLYKIFFNSKYIERWPLNCSFSESANRVYASKRG